MEGRERESERKIEKNGQDISKVSRRERRRRENKDPTDSIVRHLAKPLAVEDKSDSLDPLRYLWIGRQGRVASIPQGAKREGSIVIHRHTSARDFQACCILPNHLPLTFFLFLALLCILARTPFVALTNLPAACTHKHTLGTYTFRG